MMDKRKLFYSRLIKAMEKTGKSVNQIERELGYPRNALHNYKNGGAPSAVRLIELAQYFQLPPEYFIGQPEGASPLCPTSFFQQLDEEQKLEIYKLAHTWGMNQIKKLQESERETIREENVK